MTLQTFAWSAEANAEGVESYSVLSVKFGDGYAQEVGEGINSGRESWPLTFNGYGHEVKPIRNFLREHAGFRRFLWTPPLGDEGLYICREFRIRGMGGDYFTLTATFEQRFAP